MASHDEYKATADACYKSGDYRGAISHYTLAIASASQLQQQQQHQDDHDASDDDADMESDDDDASATTPPPPITNRTLASYYSNRAAASTMILRYVDALSDCERAIDLDPTFLKVRIRKARVLTTLGRWQEASATYSRAMVYDPNDAALLKAGDEVKTLQRRFDLLGVLLDGSTGKKRMQAYPYLSMPPIKESKQALNQINLILVSSPDSMELLLYKLRALVYLSNVQEAYALSTSLMRRSSAASGSSQPAAASKGERDSLLLLLRAHCLYCMGNLDDAVKHARQILSGDPDSKDAFAMHKLFKTLSKKKAAADAAYKTRQFADSVALYTEALESSPGGDPEAATGAGGGLYRAKLFFNRASAAANLQQHASVVADCTRALRRDDSYVKAYTRRAASRLALADEASNAEDQAGAERRCREAIRDYERAGELTAPGGPRPDAATHADVERKGQAAQVQLKRAGQRDLYKILSVRRDAPEVEIKKCYRKKAMKWHPDRHASSSEEDKAKAETIFRDVNLAYEILSDSEKRRRYDSGVDVDDVDNPDACPGGHHGGFRGGGGGRGHGGIDPDVLFQMFMQQQQGGFR